MRKTRRSSKSQPAQSDSVSVGFWMFAQFLLILPIVNFLSIAVLAFLPGNQSRKNFFQALLVWLGLIVVLHLVFFAIGVSPFVFAWLMSIWDSMVRPLFP